MKGTLLKNLPVWLFTFILFPSFQPVFGQPGKFFDIIPDLGGLNDQGQGWIVKPDTDAIYVLGDLIDILSTPGDTVVRPFFARFDYNGNMEYIRLLYDKLSGGEFEISTRPVILYKGSILCYINFLHDTAQFYRACMMELECTTGKMLRYRLFPHPPGQDSASAGQFYYMDSTKNITAFHYLQAERQIYIRQISPIFFNIIKEVLVDTNGRRNFPKYIEAESDSTFILVGISRGEKIFPLGWYETSIFYLRVSQSGEIMQYKIIPELNYEILSSSAANSYTVLRKSNGDWIVSSGVVRVLDQFGGYYDIIPFSAFVSPEFDTLRWITFFGDEPFEAAQNYDLAATCWATDSSGFVVLSRNYKQADRTTYLTKISPEGEKLWTRHFIPLGFEHDQLSWANMEDVRSTPHNTFVMVGTFFDRDRWIRRPWLMHVDAMGCLVPGCDGIVDVQEPFENIEPLFTLFPNPASQYIAVLCRYKPGSDAIATLSVLDMEGRIRKAARTELFSGGQYLLDISDLEPGAYFLRIEDSSRSYAQVESFIKL